MKLKDIIINPDWHFWKFGWRYVAEPLIPVIDEIKEAFLKLKEDDDFLNELRNLYKNYIWRPSPLIFAENLTRILGWAKIYLKNEWVNHTWAHKINHCIWQILIAKYLWKKRVIAETWAWQHWLATASVCAKMWLECVIYMWKKDYDRQRPNVIYMELAWAKVIPVLDWNQTLKSAVNKALKDLLNNSSDSYYLLWTACWPHPYPSMNVFFQKIISEEVRKQLHELESLSSVYIENSKVILPDYLVACVWWWSNALWFFYDFLDDLSVKMIWVEAWWKWTKTWKHASRFVDKKIWFVEWFKSYFIQDNDWQVLDTYSISAWLDYSWVSPQISYLEDIKRIEMKSATDSETLNAVKIIMQTEGILPALESAHWLAEVLKLAPKLKKDKIIICNLSWRGDKDLFITAPKFDKNFISFLNNYIKINK